VLSLPPSSKSLINGLMRCAVSQKARINP
jgi:hypothetical protein